jgi:hypothetical protein
VAAPTGPAVLPASQDTLARTATPIIRNVFRQHRHLLLLHRRQLLQAAPKPRPQRAAPSHPHLRRVRPRPAPVPAPRQLQLTIGSACEPSCFVASTLPLIHGFRSGDSYTQTGFDITGTQPAIGNPLGNPTYPGYTATGGANWIDAATVTYNHSIVLTYNFAYGGATIDGTCFFFEFLSVSSLTSHSEPCGSVHAHCPLTYGPG